MPKKVNLLRAGQAVINGEDIVLRVVQDEDGRVLVSPESVLGGQRIKIRQHEEEPGTIIFYIDREVYSSTKSGLKLLDEDEEEE